MARAFDPADLRAFVETVQALDAEDWKLIATGTFSGRWFQVVTGDLTEISDVSECFWTEDNGDVEADEMKRLEAIARLTALAPVMFLVLVDISNAEQCREALIPKRIRTDITKLLIQARKLPITKMFPERDPRPQPEK